MFLAAVAAALFLNLFLPKTENRILRESLDAAGIVLVLTGFLFRVSGRGYKFDHSSEGIKLVTGGVYALIRNPMYLGTFLIGVGVSLYVFSWWAALAFGFIFLAIYVPQIKKEEKILNSRFGQVYKHYCQVAPRFFPRPSGLFNKSLRQHIFFKWRWVKKELPSLIAVIVLLTAAGICKDVKLYGGISWQKELIKLDRIIFCLVVITIIFYEKENLPKKI